MMFILAREGESYARLRFNVGPCAEMVVPVSIDYSRAFAGCDVEAWKEEYLANVQVEGRNLPSQKISSDAHTPVTEDESVDDWYENWFEYTEDQHVEGGFIE